MENNDNETGEWDMVDSSSDLDITLEPMNLPGPVTGEPEQTLYEDLPPMPASSTDPGSDVWVLEMDDLIDEAPTAGFIPAPAGPELPPVTMGMPGSMPIGKKGMLGGGLVGSLVLQMALAGAIGGVLSWLVVDPAMRASEMSPFGDQFNEYSTLDLLIGPAIGGGIGLALGAVDGIVLGAWTRALMGALLGCLVGGAGSFIGGILAGLLYTFMGGGTIQGGFIQQVLARSIAWALLGFFVGVGPGLQMMAPRKIINGIIGGLVGGCIGGLLFDPIGAFFSILGGQTGTISRLVGFAVLGGISGAAIGMVEEFTKQAWLSVIDGPLSGKEFIIYKTSTIIGSAHSVDIPLIKDQEIAPKHCLISAGSGAHILKDLSGGSTYVNERVITSCNLRNGDYIQIGATVLQYQTRSSMSNIMQ